MKRVRGKYVATEGKKLWTVTYRDPDSGRVESRVVEALSDRGAQGKVDGGFKVKPYPERRDPGPGLLFYVSEGTCWLGRGIRSAWRKFRNNDARPWN